MKQLSVLFGMALLIAVVALSAGSGRDQLDPERTGEVTTRLAQSPLREFAGLPPATAKAAPPAAAAPFLGAAFIPRPLAIAAGSAPVGAVPVGYTPLIDVDALYGVHGPPAVLVRPAPAFTPPADLIDDTPAMVAAVWANPPLDAK